MIYYSCDGYGCQARQAMAGTSLALPSGWAEMSITMALKPTTVKHLCPKCVAHEERRARGEVTEIEVPPVPVLKGRT